MSNVKNIIVSCLLVVSIQAHDFTISSISDLIKKYPEITYSKCHDAYQFDYKPFLIKPLFEKHPHKGMVAETFVLNIPNGIVCSDSGVVRIGNEVVQETLSKQFDMDYHKRFVDIILPQWKPCKVAGRVLVLTRWEMRMYFHWLIEVLGAFALPLMHNIEYDWVYIPYGESYVQEALELLGVSKDKIIQPWDPNAQEQQYFCIQADELIVPSLINRLEYAEDYEIDTQEYVSKWNESYTSRWNIDFLKDNFVPLAKKKVTDSALNKKVFISRQKAPCRRMINEDDVFALFEPLGFKRYVLEELSFLEQVRLFNNAKVVVGAHGSGLSNMVFCESDALVVEIIQNRYGSCFWDLAQVIGIEHDYIETGVESEDASHVDTRVSLANIQKYIIDHIDRLQ